MRVEYLKPKQPGSQEMKRTKSILVLITAVAMSAPMAQAANPSFSDHCATAYANIAMTLSSDGSAMKIDGAVNCPEADTIWINSLELNIYPQTFPIPTPPLIQTSTSCNQNLPPTKVGNQPLPPLASPFLQSPCQASGSRTPTPIPRIYELKMVFSTQRDASSTPFHWSMERKGLWTLYADGHLLPTCLEHDGTERDETPVECLVSVSGS